jgi:hypothetical protein
MTAEEWKTFLDVVKVTLECVAIIGAGIWATYTFGSLRQIARAKAEMTKLDSERRRTDAEVDRLTEQARIGAVIQISLDALPLAIPDDRRRFVEVTVEIFNGGSRNVHIAYPQHPLNIYAADINSDGLTTYRNVASCRVASGVDPNSFSKGMLARAGGRYPLSFVVPVPASGLYLIVFSVPVSEAEQAIATQFGFSSKGRWSGKKFVTIPRLEAPAV